MFCLLKCFVYLCCMENMTGYTIGFGGKFWTLWNVWVENKYNQYLNTIEKITHNDYIQNLSFDLEKAKESFIIKTNNSKLQIDKELKGTSFIVRERVEIIKEDDEYQYGKYKTAKLSEIDDINYLMWYYNDNNNTNTIEAFTEAFMKLDITFSINFSFKNYDNEETSANTFRIEIHFYDNEEEKQNILKNYKNLLLSSQVDELNDIYFYEDKEKIEKEFILVSLYSVNTQYGTLYTYNFLSEEDSTKIVYSGSKEYDISLYNVIRLKGMIKHKYNNYFCRKETKIQRMKIIN